MERDLRLPPTEAHGMPTNGRVPDAQIPPLRFAIPTPFSFPDASSEQNPAQEVTNNVEVKKLPFDRILIVSNRLPGKIELDENGEQKLIPTIGGLAKALHAVAKSTNGNGNGEHTNGNGNGNGKHIPDIRWLGWDGVKADGESEVEGLEEAFETLSSKHIIKLHSLSLTTDEVDAYYNRIANNGFWMLFHDRPDLFTFDLKHWKIYNDINEKFAKKTLEKADPIDDFIWIQDYHLMRAAHFMRQQGAKQKLGFFLHIPFPQTDMLDLLPEQARTEMLEGLLAHNLVGFQTIKDRENFVTAIHTYIPGVVEERINGRVVLSKDGNSITVDAFPISIDPQEVKGELENPGVIAKAKEFRELFPNKKIMADISRLDPTKGIIEALDAFDMALTDYPTLRDQLAFVRVAQPSRLDVPAYAALQKDMKQRVKEINEKWNAYGEVVKYIPGLAYPAVIALLSETELGLVASLADGMNLVAKEYAIAGPEDGTLIIGKNAGAAQELGENAFVIDPKDTKAFAKTIYDAATLPEDERKRRKAAMNAQVHEHDVEKWADAYFAAAASA